MAGAMQLTAISSCSCSSDSQGRCPAQPRSKARVWSRSAHVFEHAASSLQHFRCCPMLKTKQCGKVCSALFAVSNIASSSSSSSSHVSSVLRTQELQVLLQESAGSWQGLCDVLVAYGLQLSPSSMTEVCAAMHQLLHRSSTQHTAVRGSSPCLRYPRLWDTLLQQARLEAGPTPQHYVPTHGVQPNQQLSSLDSTLGREDVPSDSSPGVTSPTSSAARQSCMLPPALQQEIYEEHDDLMLPTQDHPVQSAIHSRRQVSWPAKQQQRCHVTAPAAARHALQLVWHVATPMFLSASPGPSQAALLALTLTDAACTLGLVGGSSWHIKPTTLVPTPAAAAVCRLCQHAAQAIQACRQPTTSTGSPAQGQHLVAAAAAASAIAWLIPRNHQPLNHTSTMLRHTEEEEHDADAEHTKAGLIAEFWRLLQQANILPITPNIMECTAVPEAAAALLWSQSQCRQPVDQATLSSVLEALTRAQRPDAVGAAAAQPAVSLSAAQLLDLMCAVVVQGNRVSKASVTSKPAEQSAPALTDTGVQGSAARAHGVLNRPAWPQHHAALSAAKAKRSGQDTEQPLSVQQPSLLVAADPAEDQAAVPATMLHMHTPWTQLDRLLHALLLPASCPQAVTTAAEHAAAQARTAARAAAVASGQHARQPAVIKAVRAAARHAAEEATAQQVLSSSTSLSAKEVVVMLSLLGWAGVRLSSFSLLLVQQLLRQRVHIMTAAELAAVVVAFGRMRTGMKVQLLRSLLACFQQQLPQARVTDVAALVWALPWVSKAYTLYLVRQERALMMALVDHTLPALQAVSELQGSSRQAADMSTTQHAVDGAVDSRQHEQVPAAAGGRHDHSSSLDATQPAAGPTQQGTAATAVTPAALVQLVSGFSRLGYLPYPLWLGAHRQACLAMEHRFSAVSKQHLRAAYLAFLKM